MTPERTTAPSIERAELVRIVQRVTDDKALLGVALRTSEIHLAGRDFSQALRHHLKLGPEPIVVTVTDKESDHD